MKSLSLHTDLYQINMAYAFFNDNKHEKKAVFELYFRQNPFNNGYAVFAGLERVISYLDSFCFNQEDINYLAKLDYSKDFLDYLSKLKFTGTLKSVLEGEVVFAKEPLMIIEANLIEAQLIETALLNIVNFQTLVATKASRIRSLVPNHSLYEFGARRAQEIDAALWGTRAAYISGFDGTSLVSAGKKFGIPLVGTHSHSFVQVFEDEYTAFKSYAKSHYNCTFLVDTYDTLKAGVPNAIKVAKEFTQDKNKFNGIRIDSGDLTYHANEARKMLDDAGFTDAKIIVSNDLDEDTIASLVLEGAKIDAFGIGTKLITSYDQPALGGVYKLVAIERNNKMVDVIKISNNVEKITNPGLKKVYRVINKKTLKAEGDFITLSYENIDINKKLRMYNESNPFTYKEVFDYELMDIHNTIYENGELVYSLPSIEKIRKYHTKAMSYLWDEHKRYRYPAKYYVNTSLKYYENKYNLVKKYQ